MIPRLARTISTKAFRLVVDLLALVSASVIRDL
jgi:hypothetical protein